MDGPSLNQFMKSFCYREKEIEKYREDIEKLSIEIDLLKKDIDEREYNYVSYCIESSWKPRSILRDNAKLYDEKGELYYEQHGLKRYSKAFTECELRKVLCHLYLTEADILKDEVSSDLLMRDNVYVGSQITKYVGCNVDIVNEKFDDKEDGEQREVEDNTCKQNKEFNEKLKNEIDENMNKSKDEIYELIEEKTEILDYCLLDLKTKLKLCDKYEKLKKYSDILNKVKREARDMRWLRSHFDKEMTKEKKIINRKSEIELFEKRVKFFSQEIEFLKSKSNLSEAKYDQIIKETEENSRFNCIFTEELSVIDMKNRLMSRYEVESYLKKTLIQALHDINNQQFAIAQQEVVNDNALLQPSVSVGEKKKQLPYLLKSFDERGPFQALLGRVNFAYRKLNNDYEELEKKEKLYNDLNKTVKIVVALEKIYDSQNSK